MREGTGVTYWTHYWAQRTVESQALAAEDDSEMYLGHTASNMFGRLDGKFDINDAKVHIGDTVYCLSQFDGRVLLLGRLEVGEVVDQRRAERLLDSHDVWRAKYHLIANPDTVTPLYFDLFLPTAEAKKIEFINGSKVVPPLFVNGRLDQQTLRPVRRLTPAAAARLDAVLVRSGGRKQKPVRRP